MNVATAATQGSKPEGIEALLVRIQRSPSWIYPVVAALVVLTVWALDRLGVLPQEVFQALRAAIRPY